MPNSVRRNTNAVSDEHDDRDGDRDEVHHLEPDAAELDRVERPARARGTTSSLGDTKTCHSACDSRSRANDVSSIVNGLALRTQRNATAFGGDRGDDGGDARWPAPAPTS